MTFDIPFISTLVEMIWTVIGIFIKILLWPIDMLIKNFIPGFDNLVNILQSWLDLATTNISWLIDALGIPKLALELISLYVVFALSSTTAIWGIKIIANWKRSIL